MSGAQLPSDQGRPVFLDVSGRRWQHIRRVALLIGIVSTALFLAVVVSILIPPLLPDLHIQRAPGLRHLPRLVTTRAAREAAAMGRRIGAEERRLNIPRARRGAALPPRHTWEPVPHPSSTRDPLVVGFYVDWDDNSLASVGAHGASLDWIIAEWAFVTRGGDSLRISPDSQLTKLLTKVATFPDSVRPQIFVMVSNVDTLDQKFGVKSLHHMLSTPAARDKAVSQLTGLVRRLALGGVTLDFEEVPASMNAEVLAFTRIVRDSMTAMGRLTTSTLQTSLDKAAMRRYADANDKVIPMLYDEHFRGGDPGPAASQRWYVDNVRRVLTAVPPVKAILAIGAYGYDWNDANPTVAEGKTFQEVMMAATDAKAPIQFDSVSLNPYVAWTDPDSTDHIVWYLDGVTMYNQILAGEALGAAGHAVWRLGSEDPSIWQVIGRHGIEGNPLTALQSIPGGYDPKFEGFGEILDFRYHPTAGARTVKMDSVTRYLTGEQVTRYPLPYVVRRFGDEHPGRVALTFDDGPDGTWTPAILDTLRSRNVKATFFVIGRNVQAHIPIMRRIVAEGHEFGNHTYSHPNLAVTPAFISRLEIDANERLLEAVLDRRSAFFRPPFFGDAEPTTADELVPVEFARDRGYLTIGLHVDSEDWEDPGTQRIIDTVLAQRNNARPDYPTNIVLLHDGGGNRSQTVAALGPLIDSLRARGDTLVLVSELVGISAAQAMPALPPRSALVRSAEFAAYGAIGIVEWVLHWIFLIAVVLGLARLIFITSLALFQRVRRHQRPEDPIVYAPPVSVIVPAYNEARVINRTIETLLAQDYPGELEIVVVDDGSPDDTFEVVRRAFGANPRVAIYRKSNGGKSTALNLGLARARGEIVICLDADTLFATNTVAELVAPMVDPRVGAVAGNAKVGNRINLVTRWQALEYVISQNLDRRAFSTLNSITVVPGAVGAWRKSLVLEVGGFSDDTLAEDQDLTLSIRRHGYSIAYADGAIGYTEAPDTMGTLAKQRFRWSFGTLQCMWKHRDVLFRPRYGSLGFIALPNTWIFQLFFTAISPVADLMFVWSLISVWLARIQHGGTYALTSLRQVMILYAIFLLVDWLASVLAFLMEPGEDWRLTWLIFLQRFAYRQLMYWVVVKSFVAAVQGRVVGWGKLERKATVELPPETVST